MVSALDRRECGTTSKYDESRERRDPFYSFERERLTCQTSRADEAQKSHEPQKPRKPESEQHGWREWGCEHDNGDVEWPLPQPSPASVGSCHSPDEARGERQPHGPIQDQRDISPATALRRRLDDDIRNDEQGGHQEERLEPHLEALRAFVHIECVRRRAQRVL